MIHPPEDAAGFAQWLKEKKACAGAREWSAGKDLRTVWKTCPRGTWLHWLLTECGYFLEASSSDEYDRIEASARAEYERIEALVLAESIADPARTLDECIRTIHSAWDEYQCTTSNAIRSLIPYPFGKATSERNWQ